jgi:hypothetical protein
MHQPMWYRRPQPWRRRAFLAVVLPGAKADAFRRATVIQVRFSWSATLVKLWFFVFVPLQRALLTRFGADPQGLFAHRGEHTEQRSLRAADPGGDRPNSGMILRSRNAMLRSEMIAPVICSAAAIWPFF